MTAARPQDFRSRYEPDWIELEALTERVLERGIAHHHHELPALLRLHRRVASSLAVARTMVVERGVLRHLEALLVRSHLALHGSTTGASRSAKNFFAREVPGEIRRAAPQIAWAGFVLVLGLVFGWAFFRLDPAWFFALVDEGWALPGSPASKTSTLALDFIRGDVPVPMALRHALLGLLAFAFGIAAGIPTALVLFCGGMGLGAVLALHATRGLGTVFVVWFLPAGVPEIFGLLLCGSAGFTLARAIAFPQRAGLGPKEAGRRAALLMVAALVLLAIGCLVETVFAPVLLAPEVLIDHDIGLASESPLRVGFVALELLVLGLWLRGGAAPTELDEPCSRSTNRATATWRPWWSPERQLDFDTAEGHRLHVSLATPGERWIAGAVDLALVGVLYGACALVLGFPLHDWTLVVIVGFGLRHTYFVVFHRLWQGATPGKRLMGLRLMDREGEAIETRRLFARSLATDAELFAIALTVAAALEDPVAPVRTWLLVGWTLVLLAWPVFNAHRQRLADRVAHTVVIRVPKPESISEEADWGSALEFTPEQLSIYDETRLDALAQLLRQLVVTQEDDARRLADRVAHTIADKIGLEPDAIGDDPEHFLRAFYGAQRTHLERQRLHGKPPTPGPRPLT